jgi:hypothetical protein
VSAVADACVAGRQEGGVVAKDEFVELGAEAQNV